MADTIQRMFDIEARCFKGLPVAPYDAMFLLAQANDMFAEAKHYKEALLDIVSLLGPLNSEHTDSCISCPGCNYEWKEALLTAMDTVAWTSSPLGPGHTKAEWSECQESGPCVRCIKYYAEYDQIKRAREEAWTEAGFVHDLEKDTWDRH